MYVIHIFLSSPALLGEENWDNVIGSSRIEFSAWQVEIGWCADTGARRYIYIYMAKANTKVRPPKFKLSDLILSSRIFFSMTVHIYPPPQKEI
jgi:hypothetical protein